MLLWQPSQRHSASAPNVAVKRRAMSSRFALAQRTADSFTAEIFLRRERIRFHAFTKVLIHMRAQDGFAQSTRTAVNEQDELLFAEVQLLERSRIANLFNSLQLGEVIAATDGAER